MKIKIKRALLSVFDKSMLDKILPTLKKYKIEILSSGGTFKYIKKKGYKCVEISDFTNSPEILDGRVKTLHPKIHAGILFKRNNKKHVRQMTKNNFSGIDLVIVNFYPFEKTLKNPKNDEIIIENIDIGGPSLVRAAAKNFKYVNVVTTEKQSDYLINELKKNNGSTSLNFRKNLAEQAFAETANYDRTINSYFNSNKSLNFPDKTMLKGELVQNLRYGENPHQSGAIYSFDRSKTLIQLNGKHLSYNNYNDIFYGLEISKSLPKKIGTVIIKHANPCGVSAEKDQIISFQKAFECDPISAYGGVVICNYKLNINNAKKLNDKFFEVIVAEGFKENALKLLKKKKNLRLIDTTKINLQSNISFQSILNGFLLQSTDFLKLNKTNFMVVSKRKPSSKTLENLMFAFNVCRYVKSNAIVISKNLSTVGIGSGQPSRLDSCKIAVNKMIKFSKNQENLVAASDAFFPFVDGIETLVQSGVRAVIQPSGSIRDKEIIKFANDTNTVLVFSKTRHFRH